MDSECWVNLINNEGRKELKTICWEHISWRPGLSASMEYAAAAAGLMLTFDVFGEDKKCFKNR
jgi:hypothetical protein